MCLVTTKQIAELPEFKGFSERSIISFLNSRGVPSVDKLPKKTIAGSRQNLYIKEEVLKAFQAKPLTKRNSSPYPQTKPLKQKEINMKDFERGFTQPFRNIKCPDYQKCMMPFLKKDGVLDCSQCEKKDTIDENWRYR